METGNGWGGDSPPLALSEYWARLVRSPLTPLISLRPTLFPFLMEQLLQIK